MSLLSSTHWLCGAAPGSRSCWLHHGRVAACTAPWQSCATHSLAGTSAAGSSSSRRQAFPCASFLHHSWRQFCAATAVCCSNLRLFSVDRCSAHPSIPVVIHCRCKGVLVLQYESCRARDITCACCRCVRSRVWDHCYIHGVLRCARRVCCPRAELTARHVCWVAAYANGCCGPCGKLQRHIQQPLRQRHADVPRARRQRRGSVRKRPVSQVLRTRRQVFVTLQYCRRGPGVVRDVNSSGTGGVDEDARGVEE
jgi:hypothetical protein